MENTDHGLLEHWLLNIRDVRRLHQEELEVRSFNITMESEAGDAWALVWPWPEEAFVFTVFEIFVASSPGGVGGCDWRAMSRWCGKIVYLSFQTRV